MEIDDETLSTFLKSAPWEQLLGDPDVKALCNQIKKKAEGGGEDVDVNNATRIKLVVVGDGAVGKTCLLISFATDKFPEEYIPTVFENYTAPMSLNGESILLHLWDTAGQEEYDRLRPLSYPGSDIVLLCFSLAHKPSYDAIKVKWYPEIHHYVPSCPYLLVGTKLDLREEVANKPNSDFDIVTTEMGAALCKEINALKYIETSAKTKQNLDQVYNYAVTSVLELNGASKPSGDGAAAASSPAIESFKSKQHKKGNCILL